MRLTSACVAGRAHPTGASLFRGDQNTRAIAPGRLVGAIAALSAICSQARPRPRRSTPSPAPRPGPDLLYSDGFRAPQLGNRGVWKAPPILVSGTTAYRRGEAGRR